MARARSLKPGFFTNEILAEIPPLGRLLFQGLWCIADREGRLEDRPKKIRAELLPYDECDINSLLQELDKHGFIVRYEADGKRFIQVLNFKKHQNPHVKESPSLIPAPDEHSASTVQAQCKEQPLPARAGPITHSLNPIPLTPFPVEVAPSKTPPSARGSRLPMDWVPDAECVAFCRDKRPELDPDAVAGGFRDYWVSKPGADGRKVDWVAVWRNWVRKERALPTTKPAIAAWWQSDGGMRAKAAELGLSALPGESMPSFRDRINAKLEPPAAPNVTQPMRITPQILIERPNPETVQKSMQSIRESLKPKFDDLPV